MNQNHLLLNWFLWQPQQHSDVTSGCHLGFSNFQIFFSNSNLNTENSEKTTFSDWVLQNCKIHYKIISILVKIVAFLVKNCIFVVNTQVA